MKQISREVPTNFIRLDDAVTSDDRFLNVRDLQIARLNHNKLVGHTGIRTVFSVTLRDSDWPTYYPATNRQMVGMSHAFTAVPFFRQRVLLNEGVNECEFYAIGSHSSTPTTRLYPVLSPSGSQRQIALDEYTEGTDNCTVTVPPSQSHHYGFKEYDLVVYFNQSQVGANISGPLTISSVGAVSVAIATASLAGSEGAGNILRFDTSPASTPYPSARVVGSRLDLAGTSYFYIFDGWTGITPVAGTHRAYFEDCSYMQVQHLALLEKPRTDFDTFANWIF